MSRYINRIWLGISTVYDSLVGISTVYDPLVSISSVYDPLVDISNVYDSAYQRYMIWCVNRTYDGYNLGYQPYASPYINRLLNRIKTSNSWWRLHLFTTGTGATLGQRWWMLTAVPSWDDGTGGEANDIQISQVRPRRAPSTSARRPERAGGRVGGRLKVSHGTK